MHKRLGVDAALRAIAEPNRRAILRLARDDERSAGDIAVEKDIFAFGRE